MNSVWIEGMEGWRIDRAMQKERERKKIGRERRGREKDRGEGEDERREGFLVGVNGPKESFRARRRGEGRARRPGTGPIGFSDNQGQPSTDRGCATAERAKTTETAGKPT
jgi:hypothetical protein